MCDCSQLAINIKRKYYSYENNILSERKITNHFIVQNINNTLDPLRLLYSKICVSASVHLGMFSFSIFLIGANINSNNNNLKLESRQIMTLNSSFVLLFCLILVLSIFLTTKIYQCYNLISKNFLPLF